MPAVVLFPGIVQAHAARNADIGEPRFFHGLDQVVPVPGALGLHFLGTAEQLLAFIACEQRQQHGHGLGVFIPLVVPQIGVVLVRAVEHVVAQHVTQLVGCGQVEDQRAARLERRRRRLQKLLQIVLGQQIIDPVAGAQHGVRLAVQGCEHINRALCTDRETARAYGLTEVAVEPWLRAGGAAVTEAKRRTPDAVMVEDLRSMATLGIDIGDTLIGMHLRAVAVPVRLRVDRIGNAILLCARTRPKFIGGSRAIYEYEKEVRECP